MRKFLILSILFVSLFSCKKTETETSALTMADQFPKWTKLSGSVYVSNMDRTATMSLSITENTGTLVLNFPYKYNSVVSMGDNNISFAKMTISGNYVYFYKYAFDTSYDVEAIFTTDANGKITSLTTNGYTTSIYKYTIK
jgi:hypothetical protein